MIDDDNNDTVQPVNPQEKEKDKGKNQFARFSKTAKVTTKKGPNLIIGLIMGLGLIFFIVLLLTRHHSQNTAAPNINNISTSNSMVLKENEARLKKMQHQKGAVVLPEFTKPNPENAYPKTSKALKTRENAPTQMYFAGHAHQQQSSESQSKSSTVLIGQTGFAEFANSQANNPSTVQATTIAHPRYTIGEGEFIHATLETAMNSDLPGRVRAVIERPVYAYVGESPLIPAGSRLIGQYSSSSSNGSASARVFVMWGRIITPSGISIMISSPGTDALGRAGIGANSIDSHFFKLFGTAALLSIMSATTATVGVNDFAQPNSANLYRHSIASSFGQAAQKVLNTNQHIKPTLHIYQGQSVNVFVAHDLDLYSVLSHRDIATGAEQENGDTWGFIK